MIFLVGFLVIYFFCLYKILKQGIFYDLYIYKKTDVNVSKSALLLYFLLRDFTFKTFLGNINCLLGQGFIHKYFTICKRAINMPC